jgi:hypothetical protein
MSDDFQLRDSSRDDEIIDVKLPRKDYEIMREMIRKQEALGWLGRYFRNVILVATGGFISLFMFWDSIKHFIAGFIK